MLTPDQLRAIMPRLPVDRATVYAPLIVEAWREFRIDTIGRCAPFLGQVAHEAIELTKWEELADGMAYEGRGDLGNVRPGDGPRYKGHGPIQVTGRKRHAACGVALGIDLEAKPELLLLPEVGFRAAAWFWTAGAGLYLSAAARARLGHGVNLNDVADRLDHVGITMAIQGAHDGLEQRLAYTLKAYGVLAGTLPMALGDARQAGGLPLPS